MKRILLAVVAMFLPAWSPGQIVADHTVVDLFDGIPDMAVQQASATRFLLRRASGGSVFPVPEMIWNSPGISTPPRPGIRST